MSCSVVADEVLGTYSRFLAHSYSLGSQSYCGHQYKVFSVYPAGKGCSSHTVIANTVQWPLLGYKWHFSFCAKLNCAVVFSSLPFYFWVLKQLPGCVMCSLKPELWTSLRNDDEWDVFFLSSLPASVSAGVMQPMPETGKSHQQLEGNLLFVNGVRPNIDWAPGSHVKLCMARPWKVCGWQGSCGMPFPQMGWNRKYSMIAKQHAVTALCLFLV